MTGSGITPDLIDALCRVFHHAYQQAAGLKPSPFAAMPKRDADNTRAAVDAVVAEVVASVRQVTLGPPAAVTHTERTDTAIAASADALLAVCALQTGHDPMTAYHRAHRSLLAVMDQAAAEARADLGDVLAEDAASFPDGHPCRDCDRLAHEHPNPACEVWR